MSDVGCEKDGRPKTEDVTNCRIRVAKCLLDR